MGRAIQCPPPPPNTVNEHFSSICPFRINSEGNMTEQPGKLLSEEYKRFKVVDGSTYWVTQKLPQICTVILRIRIGKVA